MSRSRWLGLAVVLAIPLVVVTFFFGVGRPANLAAIGGNSGGFSGTGVWMIAQFGFLAAGALIASRRPENSVGWLFFVTGALGLLSTFSNEYALQSYEGSHLPGADAAAWLAACVSFFMTPLFALLLLRFPTGTPPSRRWRPNEWLIALALLLGVAASLAFLPHRGPEILQSDIDELAGAGLGVVLGSLVFTMSTLAALVSLVSMVFRFRSASAEERQQIKWFAYAAAVAFACVMIGPLLQLVGEESENLISAAGGILLPAAAGIAILKYRLYGIDVVINRTIVFSLLAAFITGIYVGIVVGLGALLGSRGEPNLALSIAATAVVAIAFSPMKERTQRMANRLVYGQRLSPYEVLSELARSVATSPEPTEVLRGVATAAQVGSNADAAVVSLRLKEGGEIRATSPDVLPETDMQEHDLPVVHLDEEIGRLSVLKGSSDPFTAHDRELLQRLAAQAGLALHNARLALELQARLDEISAQTEELQSSRARIVSAADESRRRLEEQITSGPRAGLVSLQNGLAEAVDLLPADPGHCATRLEALKEEANRTLDSLRELARGIYPPLLADKGLVAALEAHIRKNDLPVHIDSGATPEGSRFDESVETTIYFCCVELLRGETPPSVLRIALVGDGVRILAEEIEVDPAALQSVLDRVEALGGSTSFVGGRLEVRLQVSQLEAA